MTFKEWQTLYRLLGKLEIYNPQWLSVQTVRALVKATIRLQPEKKK
jgi:hypothetical protein